MYILQTEVSEIIPVNIHFQENKSHIHTKYSLYDAGIVPNEISHTFPYPNLYSYEFAVDSR